MANVNCLQGMQCPQCGSEEPFRLDVSATVVMWDEGSDPDEGMGDLDWDNDSACRCMACDFAGTVLHFCPDDPEDDDMQGPGPDSDPEVFLAYWHQGEAEDHWSSPHGCHAQCPACQEDATPEKGPTP
jgi:hypothetical protein